MSYVLEFLKLDFSNKLHINILYCLVCIKISVLTGL